jgi:hypothetical protein
VTSLHEGEGLAAKKGVAVVGIGVSLPEITGQKNGQVFPEFAQAFNRDQSLFQTPYLGKEVSERLAS